MLRYCNGLLEELRLCTYVVDLTSMIAIVVMRSEVITITIATAVVVDVAIAIAIAVYACRILHLPSMDLNISQLQRDDCQHLD
jgi:hypothetical protein